LIIGAVFFISNLHNFGENVLYSQVEGETMNISNRTNETENQTIFYEKSGSSNTALSYGDTCYFAGRGKVCKKNNGYFWCSYKILL
jgi:hypothetical protein